MCMKIQITTTPDNVSVLAEKTVPDEKVTYDMIVAALVGALDAYTKEFLSDLPFKKEEGFDEAVFREATYDKLDMVFNRFLRIVFPEIEPEKFDLSAAAIVKASDEIIDEAIKRGVSWEQVKEEYEKKAEEYIDARKMS